MARFRPPTSWDPRFGRDDPAFDSVRAAAERLRGFLAWPTVEDLDAALRDLAPVRFVPQGPKPRRRRARAPSYDARVTLERVVPTRERSWHDLLNALVWASFPRAKGALHALAHRARAARGRSRAHDRLAMLDEGGVVEMRGHRLVFGHAILEHALAGVAVHPFVVGLDAEPPGELDARRALADRELCAWLERSGALACAHP